MILLKSLTNNNYDFNNLSIQSVRRLLRGVLMRVRMFADDIITMLDFSKHMVGPYTDRVKYIEDGYGSQHREFVFINRNVEDKTDGPWTVVEETGKFFKRMLHEDDKFIIHPANLSGLDVRKPIIHYTKISLSGVELAPFFGTSQPTITVPSDLKFITDKEPNIYHKNTNLFLYCEQITEQYVNNMMVSLLSVIPVPWDGNYGDPIHYVVNTPHFLNLASRRLEKLRFVITNRHGEAVRFQNTSQTVLVVTVLRPSRKGII